MYEYILRRHNEPHSVCLFTTLIKKPNKKIVTPAGIISRHEFLARCHDLLFFLSRYFQEKFNEQVSGDPLHTNTFLLLGEIYFSQALYSMNIGNRHSLMSIVLNIFVKYSEKSIPSSQLFFFELIKLLRSIRNHLQLFLVLSA